jgi:hypothetical protein
MTKKITIIIGIMGIMGMISTLALAETELVIDGTVTAVCSPNRTAEIVVPAGWQIDFYGYEKAEVLPTGKQIIDLNKGRRFNIVKSSTIQRPRGSRTYALLTPDMAAYPPEVFGKGIGLDCGNPAGCAFMVTCQ